MVVVEREKDAMGDKSEICAYSNVSNKSTKGNQ